MATAILPLVIDNSKPYFILVDKLVNDTQEEIVEKNQHLSFYAEAEELKETNGIRMIIRDPDTNMQLYSGIQPFYNDSQVIIAQLPESYTAYYISFKLTDVLGISDITSLINKKFLIIIELNTEVSELDRLSASNGIIKEVIYDPTKGSGTFLTLYQGENTINTNTAIKLPLTDNEVTKVDSAFIFNPQNNHNTIFIHGYNYYLDNLDTDSLLWGEYSLINTDTQAILEQSNRIYFTEITNIWQQELQLDLITLVLQNQGKNLTLNIKIHTTKGYEQNFTYLLQIADNVTEAIDDTIEFDSSEFIATPLVEKGIIHLKAAITRTAQATQTVSGFISVYRKEANVPTALWTLVQKKQLYLPWDQTTPVSIELDDITAEFGKAYIYQLYFSYSVYNGLLNQWVTYFANNSITITEPVILMTDDIFLISKKAILRIKYNPQLTNYKRNISDQIINTLGGAYPFINRNGHQKYRTFTLGGLLSYQSEINAFDQYETKIKNSYKDYVFPIETIPSTYDSLFLNIENFDIKLTQYANLSQSQQQEVYEKIFREKVLEFLYSDDVILFKSLQEGNMIVRLTNVVFTPNTQLSRNIYSFTSQATEVLEATPDNCFNYFVINNNINHYYVLQDLYAKTTLTKDTINSALAEGRLETSSTSVEGSTLVLYQNKE